jgi:hypothetical protein
MTRALPGLRIRRRLRRAVAPLMAVALGVVIAGPAWAQDPTDGDALMASLLQAEDLPADFSTLGPEDGSGFDIDSGAFSAAGGRRVVSQAWASETSGVVFDFRMELPSPEAAARYLEEAESTLSEADVTGLSLETGDPPIGEDPRHYTGVTRVGDAAISFDNYLFHVGPVAAKVYVASVELPDGEARRLAGIAADRMAGFATDEPAPGPADASPPLVITVSASASLAPSADLAELVPTSVVASCRPFHSDTAGEVAALSCANDDDLIVYSQVSDAAALDDAFDDVTGGMPRQDHTASCALGPFIGPYSDGTTRGRVACWDAPGDGLVLFWTEDAHRVLGALLADTDDPADLDAAWKAARLRQD